MTFVPCLVRSMERSELVSITLGHPLSDDYLEFVGARGARNTWLAIAYDLKVFVEVVAKEPAEVTAADVFEFLAVQRAPRRGERVVRIEDGEPGLAARTIARRLSSVAGLFEYLLARGDAGVGSNPVPSAAIASVSMSQSGWSSQVAVCTAPRSAISAIVPGTTNRGCGTSPVLSPK
jgi:integrase/recombinase XerD